MYIEIFIFRLYLMPESDSAATRPPQFIEEFSDADQQHDSHEAYLYVYNFIFL